MKLLKAILLLLVLNTTNAQHNWTRTNPGGGGAIATVGATATGKMILVASDLSGIFRSFDNGEYWDVLGANNGLLETHISSFGFDPTDDDIYFAGTYLGAYKTTNGGEKFKSVFPGANDDFDYSYIEDIAISKSNNQIGYLTHHIEPDSDGEIYKTIDGGETWHQIAENNFPEDLHLIKIMIHPSDDKLVYVLTGKSRWGCSAANLYRSTDGGKTWQQIGKSEGDILDFDLHPTNPDIVFISTFLSLYTNNSDCKELGLEEYIKDDEDGGELYKSIDGGQHFTLIGEYTGIISVGLDNPDIIKVIDVLFPYDWNPNAGTWETIDGGNTWSHVGHIENWETGFTENQYFTFSRSYNGLNKTITKDIFNSDRFFGSFGQWAWGSFDGGKTLNNISTKEISKDHWRSTGVENINGHCLDINEKNPNVVYIGMYDMGFWYTKDHGDSWTRTQPDYNIYPEYSWNIGESPIEDNIARRGAGSNVMTLINDPDRENVVWASFSKEQLTDSTENTFAYTGLFKSINYGENWILVNGLPEFSKSIRMYGLSLDIKSPVSNRTLFVTVDGDIYKSIDDGNNWELVLENGGLKFTEIDKFDGKIIYAGGENGLWRSKDGGDNWEEIGLPEMRKYNSKTRPDIVPTWTNWSDDGIIYPWEGVFDIQTDPQNKNVLYVAVHSPIGGIYKSIDAGNTWSENLLPDTDIRGIAITPFNSDIIYATSSMSYHSGGFGNSLGIQYSNDGGKTWQDANDGMAFDYGGMIEVEIGENPSVWAWSPGTGIQFSKVPIPLNSKDLSSEIKIAIYPNPINKIITINSNNSFDNYIIYSNLGQIVTKGIINSNQINVFSLNKGHYLLELFDTTKGIHSTISFIK